jgi:hypothetical protein
MCWVLATKVVFGAVQPGARWYGTIVEAAFMERGLSSLYFGSVLGHVLRGTELAAVAEFWWYQPRPHVQPDKRVCDVLAVAHALHTWAHSLQLLSCWFRGPASQWLHVKKLLGYIGTEAAMSGPPPHLFAVGVFVLPCR